MSSDIFICSTFIAIFILVGVYKAVRSCMTKRLKTAYLSWRLNFSNWLENFPMVITMHYQSWLCIESISWWEGEKRFWSYVFLLFQSHHDGLSKWRSSMYCWGVQKCLDHDLMQNGMMTVNLFMKLHSNLG